MPRPSLPDVPRAYQRGNNRSTHFFVTDDNHRLCQDRLTGVHPGNAGRPPEQERSR